MNQTQLKYARERAASILKARQDRLRAIHTTPAIKLSREEKLHALSRRTFTVKDNGSAYWYNCINFTAEKEAVFDKEAFAREEASLRSAYDNLMDELILGDNEEALRLLRDFEAAA